MTMKSLPPLEDGTSYLGPELEAIAYLGRQLTESKAILRLHLKNRTTIDLHASDDDLRFLMRQLISAFEPERS